MSSAEPRTTSGAAMFANSNRLTEPEPRNFHRPSATPINVPSTTQITVVTAAMSSELRIDSVSDGLSNSFPYH